MGYNNDNAARICFDIETAPLPDAAQFIEPAEAPSNYKDPEKIAAAIARGNAEALSRCSLDVDLCRVVALAWQIEGAAAEPRVEIADGHFTETDIIRIFWAVSAGHHLVGYNCLGFDLPVLLRRSLYLGIQAPRIQIDRFKHPQVTDLMDELSFGGKLKFRGLSFYCRRFGIEVSDALGGADIAAAVAEERWLDVATHVQADVRKTVRLASRLGFFHLPELAEVL